MCVDDSSANQSRASLVPNVSKYELCYRNNMIHLWELRYDFASKNCAFNYW